MTCPAERRCARAASRLPAMFGGALVVLSLMAAATTCSNDHAAKTTTTGVTVIAVSELPAVSHSSASVDVAYLRGSGARLVDMVDLLSDVEIVKDCARLIDGLTRIATPAELADLTAGVRDEVLASALGEVRLAAVSLAAECPPSAGEATGRLTRSAGLFRQRLAQLDAS